MKQLLFIILVSVLSVSSSAQQTSCQPTSCTPACGSSCTYKQCTGGSSFTKLVDRLPFTINDETSDSCGFSQDVIIKIPFQVSGTTYNKIPTTVTKQYKVCQTFTNTGPACPE